MPGVTARLQSLERSFDGGIVKTERRLRDVQVKRCSVFDFGADEHFDVSARMIVGDDEVSAHFHAVIEGMGMVRVHAA